MSTEVAKQICFVIMPFGEKEDFDGQKINFDDVYKRLIRKAVASLDDMECIRCDNILETGSIHSKMFRYIYEADIAIVDITSLNPNVFYELGIRHALVKSGTVLICRKGTKLPFNIRNLQVVEYDLDWARTEEAEKTIAEFIQNCIKQQKPDSPVHDALDLKIDQQPKLLKHKILAYQLRDVPDKRIGLITGNIQDIKTVDIWVNSENTNMQMARHYEPSISGVIRYLGAKKDKRTKQVVEDTIAEELSEMLGGRSSVNAGDVFGTSAGELENSHNVKMIFHVASVTGQPGKGYTPINDVGMCVRNALSEADDEFPDCNLKSILFPLIGTGTGKGKLEEKAKELIDAAINYLENRPDSVISEVYFLTRSDYQRKACQCILDNAPELIKVDAQKFPKDACNPVS